MMEECAFITQQCVSPATQEGEITQLHKERAAHIHVHTHVCTCTCTIECTHVHVH